MQSEHVTLGVGVLVALLVAWQVGVAVVSADMSGMERQIDWCEDRGGEVHNAMVLGSHGGLHCELVNGSTVHLNEVPLDLPRPAATDDAPEWPDDPSVPPSRQGAAHPIYD